MMKMLKLFKTMQARFMSLENVLENSSRNIHIKKQFSLRRSCLVSVFNWAVILKNKICSVYIKHWSWHLRCWRRGKYWLQCKGEVDAGVVLILNQKKKQPYPGIGRIFVGSHWFGTLEDNTHSGLYSKIIKINVYLLKSEI